MSVLSAILPPTVVLVGIGAAMEASKAAGWLPITVPAPSQIAAVIPAQFRGSDVSRRRHVCSRQSRATRWPP